MLLNISEFLSFNLSYLVLTICSIMLILITIKIFFSRNLLSIVIYLSIFSIIIALIYLLTDAPDVAMTEVSLGACLSTVVLLNVIKKLIPQNITSNEVISIKNKSQNYLKLTLSLTLSIIFIFILLKPLLVLPQYGLINSPIATEASKYYIEHTKQDIGIKSTIAAILAAYRGYDTLGETIVILIAGLGVLLIIANNNNVRVKKIFDN